MSRLMSQKWYNQLKERKDTMYLDLIVQLSPTNAAASSSRASRSVEVDKPSQKDENVNSTIQSVTQCPTD